MRSTDPSLAECVLHAAAGLDRSTCRASGKVFWLFCVMEIFPNWIVKTDDDPRPLRTELSLTRALYSFLFG